MSFWRPETLQRASRGAWAAPPRDAEAPLAGLSIDSRTLHPGEVFLALRGDRFNGADFLAQALDAGASMLITESPERVPAGRAPAGGVVHVPDAGAALLAIAGAYRATLRSTKVIAVTGSNGKTTTTRLIHAALSARLRGSCSQKSFNNAVGVPLTLLKASPTDAFLVAEAGVNAPGEMAALADVLRPDIGVIVSIGRAHVEDLGSIEGVCREKTTLLRAVPPGGCCIAPAEPQELGAFLEGLPGLVTFGRAPHADLRLTSSRHARLDSGALGLRFAFNDGPELELPLLGEHNATNALAAIAVARRIGLADGAIDEGLRAAAPPGMRLALRRRGDVDVLNDAYNANPDSALAAVRALCSVCASSPRRVVVLGDMLELGPHAAAGHREVGEAAARARAVGLLITVGPLARAAADAAAPLMPAGAVESLPDLSEPSLARLLALLRPGDAVLLKGSRRTGLERVDDALQHRSARA